MELSQIVEKIKDYHYVINYSDNDLYDIEVIFTYHVLCVDLYKESQDAEIYLCENNENRTVIDVYNHLDGDDKQKLQFIAKKCYELTKFDLFSQVKPPNKVLSANVIKFHSHKALQKALNTTETLIHTENTILHHKGDLHTKIVFNDHLQLIRTE